MHLTQNSKVIIFCASILLLMNLKCSRTSNDGSSSGSAAVMEQQATKLESAMDSAWQVMIKSDDNKLNNLLLLAERISYCKEYSDTEITNLKQRVEQLRQSRYSRNDIKVSANIDRYDSLTTILLGYFQKTLARHPDADNFQVIVQLKEEIAAADDSMLLYRKGYDAQVDKWNAFVKANQKSLRKIDTGRFKLLPVFRLIP